jgi:chaperonin GroEL
MAMPKQLLFNEEAGAALLRGINVTSHAVKITLGPKGRNVLIDRRFEGPTITKDGVTVAKEIELKDPLENMGAQMIREVRPRPRTSQGPGPTQWGSRAASKRRSMSKVTKDRKDIVQIAAIAASNDRTLGGLIAEAMEKVG